MLQRTLFFILSAFLLSSCNKDKIFEENYDFKNNTWSKSEVVTFEPNIENVDQEYDILIAVRHTSAYPYANVIIGLTMETPGGEKRMMQHSLIVRNEDGTFKGEGLGDIYDIKVPVFKNILLKYPGKYKFIIENRMHLVEMPDLMSIGLIIEKSDTKKQEE